MNPPTGFNSVARRLIVPAVGVLLLAASPGQAASVTYTLNQSNALADGPSYLQVTIADGAAGAVDFTVQVLDALTGIASEHFGIQSFAFNVAPGGDAEGASVGNLPAGWITRDQYRMGDFGLFDIKLYGGGTSTLQTLTFSILGIDGDSPDSYASLSTGRAPQGHFFFSGRVAEFNQPDCTNPNKCVNTALFAGNASAVPLPGAAWLFVTGAAGVLARARKRKAVS